MIGTSIEKLVGQYEGNKFGEIVLFHIDNYTSNEITKFILSTLEELPIKIRNEMENLIDGFNALTIKKEFWSDDCGNIIKFITKSTEEILHEKGIEISEGNLTRVFMVFVR